MKYEDLTEKDWVLLRMMRLLAMHGGTEAKTSWEFARLCLWCHKTYGQKTIARVGNALSQEQK